MEGPLAIPKWSNRFKVEFHSQDGILPYSNDLTRQLIDVSEFNILKKNDLMLKFGLEMLDRHTISITFNDDITNLVAKALSQLVTLEHVELVISVLSSSNTVLEQFTFSGVEIDEIRHSGFSYAQSKDVIRTVQFSYSGVDPIA